MRKRRRVGPPRRRPTPQSRYKCIIEDYGDYRGGLTINEIKEYLKKRACATRLGRLYIQFCKIAGINTMGVIVTQCCGKRMTLMYRSDVKRFADLMFEGTPTYFD